MSTRVPFGGLGRDQTLEQIVEEIPTGEEMAKRVEACLHEVGIMVKVYPSGAHEDGWPRVGLAGSWDYTAEDLAAIWQAYFLSGAPMPCWSCWHQPGYLGAGQKCVDGDCQTPGEPKTPPRELLIARRA